MPLGSLEKFRNRKKAEQAETIKIDNDFVTKHYNELQKAISKGVEEAEDLQQDVWEFILNDPDECQEKDINAVKRWFTKVARDETLEKIRTIEAEGGA